jgi:hypothetical protein
MKKPVAGIIVKLIDVFRSLYWEFSGNQTRITIQLLFVSAVKSVSKVSGPDEHMKHGL